MKRHVRCVLVCLCWSTIVFEFASCQSACVAHNVTANAEYNYLHVSWAAPADVTIRMGLSYYKVRVTFPRSGFKVVHWVPAQPPDFHYNHRFGCLEHNAELSVVVVAEFGNGTTCQAPNVKVHTPKKDLLRELFDYPLPLVAGALMMLTVVAGIALWVYLCKRYRRRRQVALDSTGHAQTTSGRTKKTTQSKKSAKRLPPSAEEILAIETNYHLTPVQATHAPSRSRPVIIHGTDEHSPLIHSSTQSLSYQTSELSSSLPSYQAPSRPNRAAMVEDHDRDDQDVYEPYEMDYENVMELRPPALVPAKPKTVCRTAAIATVAATATATAAAAAPSPRRGCSVVPGAVRKGGDDVRDDKKMHGNKSFGHRGATVSSKPSRRPANTSVQVEFSLYGNCRF